ncbi:MAG: hypothetical protein E6Q83_03555 [Thiothrix sp.]|nr:MAG: hypothetical protein E6Q83_03555 [Thiothrix sp.]
MKKQNKLSFESVTENLTRDVNWHLGADVNEIVFRKVEAVFKKRVNREAALWTIYIVDFLELARSAAEVNQAWNSYTAEQQQFITAAIKPILDNEDNWF